MAAKAINTAQGFSIARKIVANDPTILHAIDFLEFDKT
jgi:hypothetical protein